MKAYFLAQGIIQIGEKVYQLAGGNVEKIWKGSQRGLKGYPWLKVEKSTPEEAIKAGERFNEAYLSGNWEEINLPS